jgi:hypothetical protein
LGIASVSRSTSFTPTTTTSATALDKDCIQRHTETLLQCRRERYCPGLHSQRAQPVFSERRWAPEAMRPSSPAPRFVHPWPLPRASCLRYNITLLFEPR